MNTLFYILGGYVLGRCFLSMRHAYLRLKRWIVQWRICKFWNAETQRTLDLIAPALKSNDLETLEFLVKATDTNLLRSKREYEIMRRL